MRYAPQLRSASRLYYAHPVSRMGQDVRARFLSVACYFGLAPWLWFAGMERQRNLLSQHTLCALAFSFSLLVAAAGCALSDVYQYWYVVYYWSPTYEEFNSSVLPFGFFDQASVFLVALAVCLWLAAWLASVRGAWLGRTPQIPGVSWLASKYDAMNAAAYWSLLVEAALAAALLVGLDSARLTRSMPEEKADVYILYTVGGYIPYPGLYESFTPPRWAVTFAFYPLVRAGMQHFGEDGVTALPLSEKTFAEAVHNGKFIFVASHGGRSPGAFTISGEPYREYLPSDVDAENVGAQLQFAYFAGCFTGALEPEWRRVLGVDDAKIFNRLSFVDEHMLWAWFKSPGVIAALR